MPRTRQLLQLLQIAGILCLYQAFSNLGALLPHRVLSLQSSGIDWLFIEKKLPWSTVPDQIVIDSVLQPDIALDSDVLVRESLPILLRERNGWCPYSERVWLALEVLNIDHHTILIDNMGRAEAVIMTGKEKVKGEKVDMRLGNKTFFYNGTCESDSLDGCDGEPRAIILDNASSKGLIPGMTKDIIQALNPQNIMDAFDGKGKFGKRCKRIDFKEIQLIPKKDPIEKEHSICVPDETREGFQTFNRDRKKEKYVYILILISLVILFIVLHRSLLS